MPGGEVYIWFSLVKGKAPPRFRDPSQWTRKPWTKLVHLKESRRFHYFSELTYEDSKSYATNGLHYSKINRHNLTIKQFNLTSHRSLFPSHIGTNKKKKLLPQTMNALNAPKSQTGVIKPSPDQSFVLSWLDCFVCVSLHWRLLQTCSHSCVLTWVILAHSPAPLALATAVTRARCFRHSWSRFFTWAYHRVDSFMTVFNKSRHTLHETVCTGTSQLVIYSIMPAGRLETQEIEWPWWSYRKI